MAIEPPVESEERDEPRVTVRFDLRVRAGREQEFEAFMRGLSDAVTEFPGYIDARVLRPRRGNRRYTVILRFDRESNLQRWIDSDARDYWLARGEDLADAPPQAVNITGTSQERPLALALSPLDDFVRTSVSGIGLLLLGAALALVLANTPLSDSYERLWATELTIGTANFGITESLRHWVNDGLMALFFFILGLEIKREVLVGELRYPRQAALPIAAAAGGAVMPALFFLLFNLGGDGVSGWGIPIGTDTAFALGVISLLGTRVRPLLLVFLTASTIVDDVFAVLVIAIFYTDSLSYPALGVAGLLLAGLVIANLAGIHRWPVYAVLGVAVWIAIFESGVHGTLAGVLVAMTVPARSWINPSEFLARSRALIDDFENSCELTPHALSNEPQQRATQGLARLTEQVETPMTHLEHQLNPWVAYGVLPLFAFANAGIPLVDGFADALTNSITWGVLAGLVLGKPVGIVLFTWLAVRSGIALLPGSLKWGHIAGVGMLSGIGFTMSLFITELAFETGPLADAARIGILFASVLAGLAGLLVLRATLPPPREELPAP